MRDVVDGTMAEALLQRAWLLSQTPENLADKKMVEVLLANIEPYLPGQSGFSPVLKDPS